MPTHRLNLRPVAAVAAALALACVPLLADAQTAAPKHPAKVAAKPAAAAHADPDSASPAQLAAAERVFYGNYACEFGKTVQVSTLPKFPGYAELRFDKSVYIMKPVESPTGAIRLEDVRGETLVVQISAKSMLLNVKTGQRILDGCISEKHGKVAAAS